MNEYKIAYKIYWYSPLSTYMSILHHMPLENTEDYNNLNRLAEFLSITFQDGYTAEDENDRWVNVSWRDVAYYLVNTDFYYEE